MYVKVHKVSIFAALALSLGCTDTNLRHYVTFEDAVADGAITRGWMPDYFPRSAKDIIMATNVDTNEFVIKAEISEGDITGFRNNCEAEESSKDLRYFDDVQLEEDPRFKRFLCGEHGAFVEILNEKYVVFASNI